MKIFLAAVLIFSFFGFFGYAFAAEPVADVEISVPQAWATRNEAKAGLVVGDKIFESDFVATDKSGKLDIKFLDGTSIALGPSSEVEVKEFVMTDEKNKFEAGVLKGAVRLVTGDLVKRNPIGFKTTTPRSTVGIRGTTLIFGIDSIGNETITVTDMGDNSHVTIITADGKKYRIDTPNQTFVYPIGRDAVIVENNEQINLLVRRLIDIIDKREGEIEDQRTIIDLIGDLIDDVVKEIIEEAIKRPGEGEAPEEKLVEKDDKRKEKDTHSIVIRDPMPRQIGCN